MPQQGKLNDLNEQFAAKTWHARDKRLFVSWWTCTLTRVLCLLSCKQEQKSKHKHPDFLTQIWICSNVNNKQPGNGIHETRKEEIWNRDTRYTSFMGHEKMHSYKCFVNKHGIQSKLDRWCIFKHPVLIYYSTAKLQGSSWYTTNLFEFWRESIDSYRIVYQMLKQLSFDRQAKYMKWKQRKN